MMEFPGDRTCSSGPGGIAPVPRRDVRPTTGRGLSAIGRRSEEWDARPPSRDGGAPLCALAVTDSRPRARRTRHRRRATESGARLIPRPAAPTLTPGPSTAPTAHWKGVADAAFSPMSHTCPIKCGTPLACRTAAPAGRHSVARHLRNDPSVLSRLRHAVSWRRRHGHGAVLIVLLSLPALLSALFSVIIIAQVFCHRARMGAWKH